MNHDEFGNLLLACEQKENTLGNSTVAFNRHNINSNFEVRHPYLDSISAFCVENKVTLFVIAFPMSKGYRNQIDKFNPSYSKYLVNLKKYSENRFVFVDCQDFIKIDEPINFKDADHLSPCGRDLFSAYLSKILKTTVSISPDSLIKN
jgi:hypothetical protein